MKLKIMLDKQDTGEFLDDFMWEYHRDEPDLLAFSAMTQIKNPMIKRFFVAGPTPIFDGAICLFTDKTI